MSGEPFDQAALDRRWRKWAFAVVIGALLTGGVLGFLVLPQFQHRNAGVTWWVAICRAAGVSPGSPAYRQPVSRATAVPVSQVAWSTQVLAVLAHARPQAGAALAQQVCVSCHGSNGVSEMPEYPSLAGQSSAAIYKQLHDYKSGARANELMTPVAMQLSEAQLASAAVFFGRFARQDLGLGSRDLPGEEAIVRLAREGDPHRAIPACAACHTTGAGGPIETPVLIGQDAGYIVKQLHAYKAGGRSNDVYGRMRAIAGKLSEDEIQGLARYYQGVLF